MAIDEEMKAHKEALKALSAKKKAEAQAIKTAKKAALAEKHAALDEKDARVKLMQQKLIEYKAQARGERATSNILERIIRIADGSEEIQVPPRPTPKPRTKKVN